MIAKLLLTMMIAAEVSAPPVAIKVMPRVLFAGHAVRVTCVVEPRPENRVLEVAVLGYTSSERQLDGEQSRKTWEFLFDHVPCTTEAAACRVVRNDGRESLVSVPIQVTGCEQ